MTQQKIGGLTVKVELDSDPLNPRKDDNMGRMVCWHRRYCMGDEQPRESATDYKIAMLEKVIKGFQVKENTDIGALLEKHYVILPVYMYDHSRQTVATTPFSCPWDSGQLGFIYCSLENAKAYLGVKGKKAGWGHKIQFGHETRTIRDIVEDRLEGEVKEYDAFITGQVYVYDVLDENDDVIDSCGGFMDEGECMRAGVEHAQGVWKRICDRRQREEKEAADMACRGVITV